MNGIRVASIGLTLLSCLCVLDAASDMLPPLGPPIDPNEQLFSSITEVTRANWELAYALDLDEFDSTSTERLSQLMKQVLSDGMLILQLFAVQQSSSFDSSTSLTLSHRLLESRTKLDRVHQEAVDDVSTREASKWIGNFERSYSLVMGNTRLLDNCIGQPVFERTRWLKRLRFSLANERINVLTIWQAMSGAGGNDLMLYLAVKATGGDWRRSLSFLLAMARVAVRSGQLSIVETMISYEGGILRTNPKLLKHLQRGWAKRLDSMIGTLRRWSASIRQRREGALQSVLQMFIKDSGLMDSNMFTKRLHDILSDMFPWRHWFILAYTDTESYSGKTGNSMFYCDGFLLADALPGGRNLVVVSSEVHRTRFASDLALAVLKATQLDGPSTDDAFKWKQLLKPRFGTQCVTAAFVGALCYGKCKVVWAARPDRVAYHPMIVGGFVTHTVVFG